MRFAFGFQARWFSALFALIPCALAIRAQSGQLTDPDYFYHLGLTNILLKTQGLLRELPQVYGIGWDLWFTDKEFGFHILTQWAMRLGGEPAFKFLPIVLLYWTCTLSIFEAGRRSSKPWLAIFLATATLCVGTRWVQRMELVRPHVLGVLLLLGLVLSLLRSARWPALVFGIFYSISYHVVIVPALACAMAWVPFFRIERSISRAAAYGAAGLGLGLILHPSFPGNLWVMAQHLAIPLGYYKNAVDDFGGELFPLSSDQWMAQIAPPLALAILVSSVFWLKRESTSSPSKEDGTKWLSFLTLTLLALTAISPRSLEFAVPLAAILAGDWVRLAKSGHYRTAIVAAILGASFALSGINLVKNGLQDNSTQESEVNRFVSRMREAARAIPKPQSGLTKVFNCTWDSSPYILADRSDLSFVDLLDPTFLYLKSAEAYRLRKQIQAGVSTDLAGAIGEVFGAQYIYCHSPVINQSLEFDRRFERVYPKLLESIPRGAVDVRVYHLRPDAEWRPSVVEDLELKAGPTLLAQEIKSTREGGTQKDPPPAQENSVSAGFPTARDAGVRLKDSDFVPARTLLSLPSHARFPAGFDWVARFPPLVRHLTQDRSGAVMRNEDRYACVWARFRPRRSTRKIGFQGHPRHKLFWSSDQSTSVRELKRLPQATRSSPYSWPGNLYPLPGGSGTIIALICADDSAPLGYGALSEFDSFK